MSAELGLRERKKQQTRRALADAAMRLFAERGFEGVTVAEVARAADVSEATVFNYFPTKEDLVYDRLEAFEEELLTAIRERPAGESALGAFGRFMLGRSEHLRTSEGRTRAARLTRMVTSSPALQARERQVIAKYTESLAVLLAEETGASPADTEPQVAAGAMMAVHRALIDYVRRQARVGSLKPTLANELRAEGERALSLLADGLGDYAVSSR